MKGDLGPVFDGLRHFPKEEINDFCLELTFKPSVDEKGRCGCGSGRKVKNCCGKKKQRTITLDLDPKNATEMHGLTFSPEGQVFGLKNGQSTPLIGKTGIDLSYQRGKGAKVLSRGVVSAGPVYLNPSLPLVEYDHIFAIDTNTKVIRNDKVSVSCVIHCSVGDVGKKSVTLLYSLLTWYEFINVRGKEENLAWAELIVAIQDNESFSTGKIALLVDSDLGNHCKFNKRESPIYEDFFLPERFQIIYASTDSGKENLINKIISLSDKRGNDLLRKIEEDDTDEALYPVSGKGFSHFRQWYPRPDDPADKIVL